MAADDVIHQRSSTTLLSQFFTSLRISPHMSILNIASKMHSKVMTLVNAYIQAYECSCVVRKGERGGKLRGVGKGDNRRRDWKVIVSFHEGLHERRRKIHPYFNILMLNIDDELRHSRLIGSYRLSYDGLELLD